MQLFRCHQWQDAHEEKELDSPKDLRYYPTVLFPIDFKWSDYATIRILHDMAYLADTAKFSRNLLGTKQVRVRANLEASWRNLIPLANIH